MKNEETTTNERGDTTNPVSQGTGENKQGDSTDTQLENKEGGILVEETATGGTPDQKDSEQGQTKNSALVNLPLN